MSSRVLISCLYVYMYDYLQKNKRVLQHMHYLRVKCCHYQSVCEWLVRELLKHEGERKTSETEKGKRKEGRVERLTIHLSYCGPNPIKYIYYNLQHCRKMTADGSPAVLISAQYVWCVM